MTATLDLTARMELLDELQRRAPTATEVGEGELAQWASRQLGRTFSDADVEAALHPAPSEGSTALAEVPPIRAIVSDGSDQPDADALVPTVGLGTRVLQTLQWGHALPAVGVGLTSGAVLPAVVGVPVMAAGVMIGCYSWVGSLGQRWLATIPPDGSHGTARRLLAWAVPTTVVKRAFPWGRRWRQTDSADA